MKVIVIAALLVAASASDYPSKSSYSAKVYEPGTPYDFAWAVKDEPSSNEYSHKENSDGKAVSGSYRVLLPDGRVQVVNFKADDYAGYVAEVKYEEAKYKTSYPAPSYPTKY